MYQPAPNSSPKTKKSCRSSCSDFTAPNPRKLSWGQQRGQLMIVDDIFVDLTGNEMASTKIIMLFKRGDLVSLSRELLSCSLS